MTDWLDILAAPATAETPEDTAEREAYDAMRRAEHDYARHWSRCSKVSSYADTDIMLLDFPGLRSRKETAENAREAYKDLCRKAADTLVYEDLNA